MIINPTFEQAEAMPKNTRVFFSDSEVPADYEVLAESYGLNEYDEPEFAIFAAPKVNS